LIYSELPILSLVMCPKHCTKYHSWNSTNKGKIVIGNRFFESQLQPAIGVWTKCIKALFAFF